MAVPKPMLTVVGIHYRLESCALIQLPVLHIHQVCKIATKDDAKVEASLFPSKSQSEADMVNMNISHERSLFKIRIFAQILPHERISRTCTSEKEKKVTRSAELGNDRS